LARRQLLIGFMICSVHGLTACETTSAGLEIGGGANDTVVEWRSTDAQSGEMSTTLADGPLYRGTYERNASQGEVVAYLVAEDGAQISCRFRLDQPSTGMRGGGSGDCVTRRGIFIPARFPPLSAQRIGP